MWQFESHQYDNFEIQQTDEDSDYLFYHPGTIRNWITKFWYHKLCYHMNLPKVWKSVGINVVSHWPIHYEFVALRSFHHHGTSSLLGKIQLFPDDIIDIIETKTDYSECTCISVTGSAICGLLNRDCYTKLKDSV